MRKTALAIYDSRSNRYGFHALLGALEGDERFADLDVCFYQKRDDLVTGLKDALDAHEQTLVAVSFMTPQLWEIGELVRRLRETYGRRPLLVAGGPHPTGDPVGTLRMGFDLVVRGEGEETFSDLIRAIDSGEDFRAVQGTAHIDTDGVLRFKTRKSRIDLDRYPPCSVRWRRFGPMEITRGCACACRFCQTPQIFGSRPRHRSVEAICRHVELMAQRGFRDHRFLTPNAFSYGSPDGKTLAPEKIEELLRGVRGVVGNRGKVFFGTFPSEVRPEHVTPEALELVRRFADNDNLIIGAQSGSDRMLERSHRGHTVEDVRRAVRLTLDAGFMANVDFIFGLPGETAADRIETANVMRDLVKMGARVHAHTFMPLPGTAFAQEPPGRIEPEIRAALAEMARTGTVYGQWEKQEKIARRVSRYLRKGIH